MGKKFFCLFENKLGRKNLKKKKNPRTRFDKFERIIKRDFNEGRQTVVESKRNLLYNEVAFYFEIIILLSCAPEKIIRT